MFYFKYVKREDKKKNNNKIISYSGIASKVRFIQKE